MGEQTARLQENSVGRGIYPPEPTPELGYYQPKLNSYTNLVDPGKEHVGAIAFIDYKDDKGKPQKVVGRVLSSHQAALNVQNEETGQLVEVNTNYDKITKLWLKPSKIEWEDFTEFDEDVLDQIDKAGNPYVIMDGQTEDQRDFVLTGHAKSIEAVPGYRVLQITDRRGQTHLVDPNYVHFDLFATKSPVPDSSGFKLGSETIPFIEIDGKREQRTKLAKDLVADVLDKQVGIFENPKLYTYLGSDLESTQLLLKRYYGEDADNLVTTIRDQVGEKYISLLVDPGIASRFGEFLKFVRRQNVADMSPLQLRAEFSKSLGTRVVYRGMALNRNEQEQIESKGLIAPGLRNRKDAERIIAETLDYHDKSGVSKSGSSLRDEIMNRLTDFGDAKYFMTMSVSSIRDVAESVGFHSSKRTEESDVSPYLMTLNIPAISIVEPRGIFEPERPPKWAIKIGDKIFDQNYHEFEMFVPYLVSPKSSQIEKIPQPEKWTWIERPKK